MVLETLISLCVDNEKRLSSICVKKNMKVESWFLLVFRFTVRYSVLRKSEVGQDLWPM